MELQHSEKSLWRSRNVIFISLLIAFSTIINLVQPAQADSEDQYFCAVLDGKPRTFVRTEIKTIKILIILFNTNFVRYPVQ
jgi:hypothetical protein